MLLPFTFKVTPNPALNTWCTCCINFKDQRKKGGPKNPTLAKIKTPQQNYKHNRNPTH
jgi:hypothetical protein